MLINIQTTDKELKSLFDEFRKDFLSLNQKLDKIMANQADFKKAFDRIDAATSEIASDLKALADKVASMGLDETQESEILGTLNAKADMLEGMGKDPVTPVPVEPDPVGPIEPPTPGPIEPPVEPA